MNRFDLSQLKPGSHIHFIGIGGVSMSGIAQIMLQRGFCVTGSDREKTAVTDRLERLGAVIYEGHRAENVEGAELIVHTAAVHADNPEMCRAAELGIRIIDRAECLGAIMKAYRHAVGVAGTHGKTTTTSMLAHALIYADTDPTISVGGELDIIDGNIRTGHTDYFITEACEYTNSFLKFFPSIAVITNIEEDHLDFFSGIEEIRESFKKFALLTKPNGCVVAWGEDKNIELALSDTECSIITYGFSEANDYCPKGLMYNGGYPSFDVYFKGCFKCHIDLNVPGKHNILNALAAIAVCEQLGIAAEAAGKGIETFKGTHRRFEKLGQVNGASVIADYAHHPTEIRATLKSALDFLKNSLWCVFQPHTYSRTRTLRNDFLTAFDDADHLIITDIYAAREKPDGITNSADLAADIAKRGIDVKYISDFDDITAYLRQQLAADDMLLVMGAGNVIEIGKRLVCENIE